MFDVYGLDITRQGVVDSFDSFRKHYSVNTGNLMFHYALRHIASVRSGSIPWGKPSSDINKRSQGLVIPMANQLGAHYDLGKQGPLIDDVNVPVVAVGLGAQFESENIDVSLIPDGSREWLKKLSNKSDYKNIAVRGNTTYEVLDKIGVAESVEVIGCPSNFISNSINLGDKIKNKINSTGVGLKKSRISVVAGNPFLKEFCELEKKLISWVDRYKANYVIQHPQVLIELANAWEAEKKNVDLVRERWMGRASEEDVRKWFLSNSDCYVSVPQWLLDFSSKELVVGTRIHGCQAAIQAGTPAICFYIDSRTKELCETMNIPHISAKKALSLNLDDCFDLVSDFDWGVFDESRRILARKMRLFLENNGIDVRKGLLDVF